MLLLGAGLIGWAVLAVGLARGDIILPLIDAPIVAVIGFLIPAGIRFAITDVVDLDMDFDLLAPRGFAFAKIDAAVFLGGLPLGTTTIPPADLVRHLADARIDVIVGGVTEAAQVPLLQTRGVTFALGDVFGPARPVRQDILA